jgi:23S rRNA (cytidine2498-2'-O)-methyltransferase
VLDLIFVEPEKPEEFWVGGRLQRPERHSAYPGGKFPLELPPGAPSRAYLKIEEAIAVFGLPLRAGDSALEIGSAPGGASSALLGRGLRVTGIDPGEMHPSTLAHPGFRHLRKSVVEIEARELPPRVDWLLLDMNTEPRIALQQTERLAEMLRPGLLGAVLTLKLNQWKFARDRERWLDRARAMGLTRVRLAQLSTNRRELCLCGLTRRGLTRVQTGSD